MAIGSSRTLLEGNSARVAGSATAMPQSSPANAAASSDRVVGAGKSKPALRRQGARARRATAIAASAVPRFASGVVTRVTWRAEPRSDPHRAAEMTGADGR